MDSSKTTLWISYILQGLVSAMMLMGAIMNLTKSEMAVQGATELGYNESSLPVLGVLALIGVVLYIWTKTSFYGAIILTAWYGGAVATHMIHGDDMAKTFMPTLFIFAAWSVFWLRGYRFDKKA